MTAYYRVSATNHADIDCDVAVHDTAEKPQTQDQIKLSALRTLADLYPDHSFTITNIEKLSEKPPSARERMATFVKHSKLPF